MNLFKRSLPGGKGGQNEGSGCAMAKAKTLGLLSIPFGLLAAHLLAMASAQPGACCWRDEKPMSPSAAIPSQYSNEQVGGLKHQSCGCSLRAGEGHGLTERKSWLWGDAGDFWAMQREKTALSSVSGCLWVVVGKAKAPPLLGDPGHPPAPRHGAQQGPARPAGPRLTLQHGDKLFGINEELQHMQ